MKTFLAQNQFTQEKTKDFWSRCDCSGGPDVCWPWLRGCGAKGYGSFYFGGKGRAAHRVAYELTYGAIPKGDGYHGTVILHDCDNRQCVNPHHLRMGSQRDNLADMRAKERSNLPRGEQHHRAVLNKSQVYAIRRRIDLGHNIREIALEFECDPSTIHAIKNRRTWNWLGEAS